MAGFFSVSWNSVHASHCCLGKHEERVWGVGSPHWDRVCDLRSFCSSRAVCATSWLGSACMAGAVCLGQTGAASVSCSCCWAWDTAALWGCLGGLHFGCELGRHRAGAVPTPRGVQWEAASVFYLCCLANYWHDWEEVEQYPCLPEDMEEYTQSRKFSWLLVGRWLLFQYCHFVSLLCGMSGHTTWPGQNVTLATWSALMWLNLTWAVVNQDVSSTILQTHAAGVMELGPLPSTKCRSPQKVCALLWSRVIQPPFQMAQEIWKLWGNIKHWLLCPSLHCFLGGMGKGSSEVRRTGWLIWTIKTDAYCE